MTDNVVDIKAKRDEQQAAVDARWRDHHWPISHGGR
jgi:hypothetical protein